MKKFLTLKHWQLFLILVGIPIILQIVGIMAVITYKDSSLMFISFQLIMIFFIGGFFGWLYALGTRLNTKLPDTVKMNLRLFKVFLFIPVTYMLLIFWFYVGPI